MHILPGILMQTVKLMRHCVALASGGLIVACGPSARLPFTDGIEPAPVLPSPSPSLIPTVKVATAKGWPAGQKPESATDTTVAAYATRLDHPRWLYALPTTSMMSEEHRLAVYSSSPHASWHATIAVRRRHTKALMRAR